MNVSDLIINLKILIKTELFICIFKIWWRLKMTLVFFYYSILLFHFLLTAIIFGLLGIYLGSSVQAKHIGFWFGRRSYCALNFLQLYNIYSLTLIFLSLRSKKMDYDGFRIQGCKCTFYHFRFPL